MALAPLSNSLLQGFFDRFENNNNGYYLQEPDGEYRPRYSRLNLHEIDRHIAGAITIGFPALSPGGLCRWICFDEDTLLAPHETGLLDGKLGPLLKAQQYIALREGIRLLPDGRIKQGHSWIHLSEPIPAAYARAWSIDMMVQAGIPEKTKDFELFPKQEIQKKLSNCVRGPLGRHAKAGGERGFYRDAPIGLREQIIWLIDQPLNDAEKIAGIGKDLYEIREAREQYRNNFVRRSYRKVGSDLSAWEMIQELGLPLREHGWLYRTRCPVCASEGGDTAGDNLEIKKDGTWYGCWNGGWNEKHDYNMIYRKLLEQTGRV